MLHFIDLSKVEDESPEKIENLKQIIANSSNRVVGFAVAEHWNSCSINLALSLLGIDNSTSNVILLIDRLTLDDPECKIKFNNIARYDQNLVKTAYYEDNEPTNKILDVNTNRFLYLMGKPYKKHRVGILYELYKQQILSKCDYSFVCSHEIYDLTKDQLGISDQEFAKFVTDTEKNLDHIQPHISKNCYHYLGFPTDSRLYENTSFSIVSETRCQAENFNWFFTEKLWRTISNHHPFILVGYKDSYEYLTSIGIDTFEYLYKHKSERFVGSNENLNKLIVENTKYILENMYKFSDRINESVKNNYSIYQKLAKDSRSIVTDVHFEKYLLRYPNIPLLISPELSTDKANALWNNLSTQVTNQ